MPLTQAVAGSAPAAGLAHWQALLPQPVTVEVRGVMKIYLFASTKGLTLGGRRASSA